MNATSFHLKVFPLQLCAALALHAVVSCAHERSDHPTRYRTVMETESRQQEPPMRPSEEAKQKQLRLAEAQGEAMEQAL